MRYLDVWIIGSWRWEDFDGTLSLLLQLGHVLHSNKRWERKLKLRLIHLSPLSLEDASASEGGVGGKGSGGSGGNGANGGGAKVDRKSIAHWYAAARKALPELETKLRTLLEETRIVAESVAVVIPESVLSAPAARGTGRGEGEGDGDDGRFARLSELYKAIAPEAPFPFPFATNAGGVAADQESKQVDAADTSFAAHEFDPAESAYPSDAWRVRTLLGNALQRSSGAAAAPSAVGAGARADAATTASTSATTGAGGKTKANAAVTKWRQWEVLPRRVREAATLNRVIRSFSGGDGGDDDDCCESRTDCALLALPALPLREWRFGMEDGQEQSVEDERVAREEHEERSRMFVDMLELLSSGMPPLGLVASGDRKAKIALDL